MSDPLLTGDAAVSGVESGDPARADLVQLAREAVDIALAGDIKRGLAAALEARRRSREAEDRRAELAALNAAARCHSLRNDSINSLAAGIDAAGLARALGDGVALGHALCAIANTSFTLKLLDECEPFIQRAIEEALRHEDADLESRARQAYGVLLGDLGRFDEARHQLERAVEAARRDGRATLMLRVEANLVNVDRKRMRTLAERAESAALQDIGARTLVDAAGLIGRARNEAVLSLELIMTSLVSEVHAMMGDVDLGIVEALQAMDLAQRNRHVSNLPPLALRLGSWLQLRDRPQEAIAALRRGLDAAEMLRPTFRITELCEALATVEAAQGRAAAAAEWQARADQERQQFESGRQMAAGFLKRLHGELAGAGS